MPTSTLPTGPTVHYVDTGPREADQTLVFSHGFLMDERMFAPQVAALSGEFRCIAWDQRGHGQTNYDGKPFTFWDSADDALALMDQLAVERAVLIGMSQGGFLSLRAALQAPERVSGLVLLDSQAGLEVEESRPLYEAMNVTWVEHGPTRDLAAVVAELIIGTGPLAEPWIEDWLARPKEGALQPFRTLMDRDDITGRLGEIACPVLVVHGTSDVSIDIARAEVVAAAVPDCRGLVRIEGGSHAANLTHPEPVNAAIVEFLGDL